MKNLNICNTSYNVYEEIMDGRRNFLQLLGIVGIGPVS